MALDFQKKRAHLSYSECKKRHHPNDSTFQNAQLRFRLCERFHAAFKLFDQCTAVESMVNDLSCIEHDEVWRR